MKSKKQMFLMRKQIISHYILAVALLFASTRSVIAGSYAIGGNNLLALDAIDVDTFKLDPLSGRLSFWVLEVNRKPDYTDVVAYDYALVKESTLCNEDTYNIHYVVTYKFGRYKPLSAGPVSEEAQIVPDSSAALTISTACAASKARPADLLSGPPVDAAHAFHDAFEKILAERGAERH